MNPIPLHFEWVVCLFQRTSCSQMEHFSLKEHIKLVGIKTNQQIIPPFFKNKCWHLQKIKNYSHKLHITLTDKTQKLLRDYLMSWNAGWHNGFRVDNKDRYTPTQCIESRTGWGGALCFLKNNKKQKNDHVGHNEVHHMKGRQVYNSLSSASFTSDRCSSTFCQ